MGTASLARRDLGGVVDNKLKVYGTSNLRVADASIVPIPMATHIQATILQLQKRQQILSKMTTRCRSDHGLASFKPSLLSIDP
ncbi:hypothetical protein CPB84DRAFT_574461 [Gymnopilus junonius]|uniref:Glucose-methanol-choline oxidoreductase C-terminal domain-containing protein n=1 Tax=Gymnopilus junonius TaxID=109634 RepID=A0A9P5N9Y0_GYMJU|nr:hypothetical protein CPB84DRAFT_574461 [Gymnopilus junonius]